MGRRRAEPSEAPATIEPPRRSSRLATKAKVDYNERRMAKAASSAVPKTGPKKVAPRKTKKDKETKLSRRGSVAVRIVHSSCTTPSSSCETVEVPRGFLARPATLFGDDDEHDAADDDTLVDAVDDTLLMDYVVPEKKRKKETTVAKEITVAKPKKEATVSRSKKDTAVNETAVSKKNTADKSKKETTTAKNKKDTVAKPKKEAIVAKNKKDTVEKKATVVKETTVSKKDTVDKPKKETTVAKNKKDAVVKEAKKTAVKDNQAEEKDPLLEAAKRAEAELIITQPDKKVTRIATKQMRGRSVVMQRMTVERDDAISVKPEVILQRMTMERDEVISVKPEQFDPDDAFADEFREFRKNDSGEMERTIDTFEQLEAGTLAIEDMRPEDRYLAELFSPSPMKGPQTPRLDDSMRRRRPLVLFTPSTPGGSLIKRDRGKKRVAAENAKRGLSAIFDDDSESDNSPSTSEGARAASPNLTKRYKWLQRSKHVRQLFEAARGTAARLRPEAVHVNEGEPSILQRPKIQFPGIAPLPETPKSSRQKPHEHALRALDKIM